MPFSRFSSLSSISFRGGRLAHVLRWCERMLVRDPSFQSRLPRDLRGQGILGQVLQGILRGCLLRRRLQFRGWVSLVGFLPRRRFILACSLLGYSLPLRAVRVTRRKVGRLEVLLPQSKDVPSRTI